MPHFLAVMAFRRDSKIVKLFFSGEAKVVPEKVFVLLRSVGVKVPGDVDGLQSLRAFNTFDLRFTSDAARVRGVLGLKAVEGLTVTPYDNAVWVTVIHLTLDFPKSVVVQAMGRYGKVTGYEEPDFIGVQGMKTGVKKVRMELRSDVPSTLWIGGMRAHVIYPGQPRTCWRCGLGGHEAKECPNKRCSRCLEVGHVLAECKGDVVCNSCGKAGHFSRFCPDRSYAARAAAGGAAPPGPFMDTTPSVPSPAPVPITTDPVPVQSTSVEVSGPSLCPATVPMQVEPSVVPTSAVTAGEPADADFDKIAEEVLAVLHAEQDAACGRSPCAGSAPPTGDSRRASSQLVVQETLLSGSESDSPMEDSTAAPALVQVRESSDWFDETATTVSVLATDPVDLSDPSTAPIVPIPPTVTPDTLTTSEPLVSFVEGCSVNAVSGVDPDMAITFDADEQMKSLLALRKKKPNSKKRPVLQQARTKFTRR